MAVTLNASTSSGFIQTADTSGELNLQSNGTTKLSVLSTGVSGTVINGTAVASTSGTAIDFTGIPSWVKKITVMFIGVSSSGSSAPTVRLGDAGGIEITGYLGSTQAGTAASLFTTGFEFAGGLQSAARVYHGAMTLSLQNSATNSWAGTSIVGLSDGASAAIMGGSKSLSETLTQVRITFVNGTDTFDAGSINIQYEG